MSKTAAGAVLLLLLAAVPACPDGGTSSPVRLALLEPPDGGTYRADVPIMLYIVVHAEGHPECILDVSIKNSQGEGGQFQSKVMDLEGNTYRRRLQLSMPDTYTLTASIRSGVRRVGVVCVLMRACAATASAMHADRRVSFYTREGLRPRRTCMPCV